MTEPQTDACQPLLVHLRHVRKAPTCAPWTLSALSCRPSHACPQGTLPPPQVVAQLPHHMVEAVAARLPEAVPKDRRRLLKEHEHHKHRKYSHYKKHHKPPVRLFAAVDQATNACKLLHWLLLCIADSSTAPQFTKLLDIAALPSCRRIPAMRPSARQRASRRSWSPTQVPASHALLSVGHRPPLLYC